MRPAAITLLKEKQFERKSPLWRSRMRPSTLVAALMSVAAMLVATTARADITVNSATSAAVVLGAATFDVDGDGILDQATETDSPGVQAGNPTAGSFDGNSSAKIGGSQATGRQQATVEADGTTLTVTVTIDCTSQVTLSGDGAKDFLNLADAQGTFGLDFTVTKPSTFSISGAVSVGPGPTTLAEGGGGANSARLQFAGGGVNIGADDAPTDPQSDSTNVTGTLAPGQYTVGGGCSSEAPRRVGNDFGPARGEGHLSFTFNASEGQCNGPTSRWIGGDAGAFDDPQNWDPPEVPSFGSTDGECEDALFDAGQTIAVDLSTFVASTVAPATRALVPRAGGTRTAGRLHVRKVRDLVLSGDVPLVLASGGLDDRASLIVGKNGKVHIANGILQAQHARLGENGKGTLLVEGANSLFKTLGIFAVGGGTGDGFLQIRDAGTADSGDVQIGNGLSNGHADVSNGVWQMQGLGVGFEGIGELTIENGGTVDTTTANIGETLNVISSPALGNPDRCLGRPTGGGVEIRGDASAWHVQSLGIAGLGCVEVRDHGTLTVSGGELRVGTQTVNEGLLFVNGGGTLTAAGDLTVGASGHGRFAVAQSPEATQVTVAGGLTVGESLPPAGDGFVDVQGSPTESTDFLTSDTIHVPGGELGHGILNITVGGHVKTTTTADVGATPTADVNGHDGVGVVELAGEGSAQLTTWSIGTSLTVGAPTGNRNTGQIIIKDALVKVGLGQQAGLITVRHTGAITGIGAVNGVVTNHGMLLNDGLIQGPLTIDASYDPNSQGKLQYAFGGLVTFVPQMVVGPGALAATGGATASADGPLPTAKTPPPPAGPMIITGDADFSNTTLVLQFVNGFAPHQGDAFPLFEVQGQLAGGFANVEVHGLAPGAVFDVATTPGTATSLTDTVALPVVSMKAPAKLKESAKKGVKVKFTRTGPTADPLTAHYDVRGTAEDGVDYVALSGTVEFPAKKKSATVVIVPFADGVAEPPETIDLEVLPGDDYAPSIPATATITLLSTEKKPKKK